MDEYIKREDALNALLDEMVGTGYQSIAMDAIKFLPTADVVPKSEVEELREINSLLAAAGLAWQKHYENLAREIFEEIEKILADDRIDRKLTELGMRFVQNGEPTFEERIAELKKKYTEGNKDEN